MDHLILVGAGGLAREVAAAVEDASRYRILGIVDDDVSLHDTTVAGLPVLGGIDQVYWDHSSYLVICVGRGQARRQIVEQLSAHDVGLCQYATIVHPSVQIPSSCFVGVGSILLAQVALTADVHIGRHVVAMPNVTLTHDDVVDDFATLCAGVSLAGAVTVGQGAYLGANATVRQHLRVGNDSTLGMGASLLTDLPNGETWAGVPARRLDRAPMHLVSAVEGVS